MTDRPALDPARDLVLAPEGDGCRDTAIARQATPEARQLHEQMGILNGWGTALDQLVERITAG